jgi:aryl-alcohol dehydrogenase-like predicted oxidoreductase
MSTPERRLGHDGPKVSAIGAGCWAIGGLSEREGGRQHGWYGSDDAESIRALHRAYDLGITFYDTADIYGVGHSERLIGKAFADRRDRIIISSKFGKTFDAETGLRTDHHDERPEYVRAACEASLKRLGTDHLDMYLLHDARMDMAMVDGVIDTLEGLVAAGKIRAYGWSTDEVERVQAFAKGKHCRAVQQKVNVLEGHLDTLAYAEKAGLVSIIRSPLGQGLLTGKITATSTFERFDVRADWDLKSGKRAKQLKNLAAVRELLMTGGRTLAQGALCWLLAKSPVAVPIPGFKTVAQAEDNFGALQKGPLPAATMAEIEKVLASG